MKSIRSNLAFKTAGRFPAAPQNVRRPVALLAGALLLALLSGCAHGPNPGVVYYAPARMPVPPPVEQPRPGSYRPAQLPPPVEVVPAPQLAPTPAPLPGVLSADASVAASVRQALLPYSQPNSLWTRLEATVQNGVVTLRGAVPSEHERYELVQRISGLPGVADVKDHLQVSAGR